MNKYVSGAKLLSLSVMFQLAFSGQTPAFAQSLKNGILAGAGLGGDPHVISVVPLAADNGKLKARASFLAFSKEFSGGVNVAGGDVNGDAIDDILVAAGPGAISHVKVIDGRTRKEILSFNPFVGSFRGGVEIASGDVNGDKRDDIIVAAAAGATPHVIVLDSNTGKVLHSFLAYDKAFRGGVTVGSVDIDGDGQDDIITGPGAGAPPHIKAFSGADGKLLKSFYAYAPQFLGGVSVAGGFVDGDKFGDIITGAGKGGGPHVAIFSGATDKVLNSFYALDKGFVGGIRVGATRKQDTGSTAVIVGAGVLGYSHIVTLDVSNGTEKILQSFYGFQNNEGPISVAGFAAPEVDPY
jgi:hypothetical protein